MAPDGVCLSVFVRVTFRRCLVSRNLLRFSVDRIGVCIGCCLSGKADRSTNAGSIWFVVLEIRCFHSTVRHE